MSKYLIVFLLFWTLGCADSFEGSKEESKSNQGNSSEILAMDDVVELVPVNSDGNQLQISSIVLHFRTVHEKPLPTSYVRIYSDKVSFQVYEGQKVSSGFGPLNNSDLPSVYSGDGPVTKQMCVAALFSPNNPVEAASVLGPNGVDEAMHCLKYAADTDYGQGRTVAEGSTFCHVCNQLNPMPFTAGSGGNTQVLYHLLAPSPGEYTVSVTDVSNYARSMKFSLGLPSSFLHPDVSDIQRVPNSVTDSSGGSSVTQFLVWMGIIITGILALCSLYFLGFSIRNIE